MSAPLVPSPLDYIGRRHFAFHPPIRNIAPNEWVLGSGTWSEVQVVNSLTGRQIWIPRTCIGAVLETRGPVLVVGLVKELELRAGSLEPRRKGIIEMPRAAHDRLFPIKAKLRAHSGPAPIVTIRLDPLQDSSLNRALMTAGICALVVSLLAALSAILSKLP